MSQGSNRQYRDGALPPPRRRLLLPLLVLSLMLHIPLAYWFVQQTFDQQPTGGEQARITYLSVPPSEEVPEPLEEPEEPENAGQIVELARPEEEKRPEETRFLSEFDIEVPEETKSEAYAIAPEVVAPEFSEESALEQAEAEEVNPELHSTGATAGSDVFAEREYALFPNQMSRFRRSNSEGITAPLLSSQREANLAGAPSNDYLEDVDSADATLLNSREFLYADFFNRVKALVSFYFAQTANNAVPEVPITRNRYVMVASFTLDPAGAIRVIEITDSSGVIAFDDAYRQAITLAGPFENPPEGLVRADGLIHIENFEFNLNIGRARADLSGVDPRSGVSFPGLQTIAD